MSYLKDRKFSDKIWDEKYPEILKILSNEINKNIVIDDILIKKKRILKYKNCENPLLINFYRWFDYIRDKLDKDNSIDTYVKINNIKTNIQYRFQNNNKNDDYPWCLTIRYERNESNNEAQIKSEWYKIKNKIPTPKYLIWGLINKDNTIKKIIIVNLENFVHDYNEGYYYIHNNNENELKYENDCGLFETIYVEYNTDGSSSFIKLDPNVLEKHDAKRSEKNDYRKTLICNLTFN